MAPSLISNDYNLAQFNMVEQHAKRRCHMYLLAAIEFRTVNNRRSWDMYVLYYDLGNV